MATVLGVGSVIVPSFAITSSGDRAIFEPLAPARILNTRPSGPPVGGTLGPVTNGQTFELQVTGAGGVPADATAVVMNVTFADAVANGFITVFPTGTTRPDASNLNTVQNGPPVPNLVTVKLGTGGKVSFYNFGGNVNLIADVAGYYRGHDHNDIYYTKAQVDTAVATAVSAAVTAATPKTARAVTAAGFATAPGGSAATTLVAYTFAAPGPGRLVLTMDAGFFIDLDNVDAAADTESAIVAMCSAPATVAVATCDKRSVFTQDADATNSTNEEYPLSATRLVDVAAAGNVVVYVNVDPSASDVFLVDPVATAVFYPAATSGTLTAASATPTLTAEVFGDTSTRPQ
jgi:hypothetical protein